MLSSIKQKAFPPEAIRQQLAAKKIAAATKLQRCFRIRAALKVLRTR